MVGDISCAYITIINYIELGMTGVEDLHEPMDHLNHLLDNYKEIPRSNDAVTLVSKWFDKFKGLAATEKLDDEDESQMKMDLQSGHRSFDRFLAEGS